MSIHNHETKAIAAKSLDSVCHLLANALEQVEMSLSDLSPNELQSAFEMIGVEGDEYWHQATSIVRNALKEHMAKHVAKTAEAFTLDLREAENGTWRVDLWAIEGAISDRTYLTYSEAKSAADALCEFLKLRGSCEYFYQVEKKAEDRDHGPLPF